jgi:hypothetical protein
LEKTIMPAFYVVMGNSMRAKCGITGKEVRLNHKD